MRRKMKKLPVGRSWLHSPAFPPNSKRLNPSDIGTGSNSDNDKINKSGAFIFPCDDHWLISFPYSNSWRITCTCTFDRHYANTYLLTYRGTCTDKSHWILFESEALRINSIGLAFFGNGSYETVNRASCFPIRATAEANEISRAEKRSMAFRLSIYSRTSRTPHSRCRLLFNNIWELGNTLRLCSFYISKKAKYMYMLRLGMPGHARKLSKTADMRVCMYITYEALGAAGWAIDCGSCPAVSIALPLSAAQKEVEQNGFCPLIVLLRQLSECFRKSMGPDLRTGIHDQGDVFILRYVVMWGHSM